jgi:hypothetical protein
MLYESIKEKRRRERNEKGGGGQEPFCLIPQAEIKNVSLKSKLRPRLQK